jgi:membrane-associated phospholipid phosphatase
MPSLHFGWALWCAIVVVRHARHRTARVLGIAYPALTLFAIVVTANHYILDAAGGAVIVVAASWLLGVLERRRNRRSLADTEAQPVPSA